MKMAELRHGVIPEIENSLKDSETINHQDLKLLRNRVTEEIVANVVSKWTGIPVSSMMLSEKEKYQQKKNCLNLLWDKRELLLL